MSAQIGRERALQKALDEVRDDYDFVCIDTPPSLGLLTVNALTAADKVIVPVQCEYLSMRGLVQLQNTLQMIRENLNPGVEIEGILPTMLDSRTVHAKEAVEILEENFGDLVFESRIRKAIKFAEAPVRGSLGAQVRPEEQRRQVLPRARRGGPHPWARKRASMREGPLADLFRSTDESVAEEEVRVTATARRPTEPEVDGRRAGRARGRSSESPTSRPAAEVESRRRARARLTPRPSPPARPSLDPATDPAVEEIDRAARHAHRTA